jgi:hypothetical protein
MGVRKELFVGVGTAFATLAGLFAVQFWYASYLDVAIVHGDKSDVRMGAKLEATRNEEQAKLTSGSMPISQALVALAERGRSAFPKLAAKPSGDLSAMSGWIHKPGFKTYVPRQVAGAAEAKPIALGAQPAPPGAEGPR